MGRIVTKNYIYKCKLNEAKPNTIELKNKIKTYQSFDQYIAKKNNTVQAYDKFWAPIYTVWETIFFKHSPKWRVD